MTLVVSPAALYQLHYPAQGQPDMALEAARLLTEAGFATTQDDHRGLDHGAWVPLMHLLPAAHVPVFQVSMPHTLTTAQALHLGQALAPLRAQGVVIMASGSMTHNLYEFSPYATRGGALRPGNLPPGCAAPCWPTRQIHW